ncbi:MAG: hypothetical protein K0R40_2757 [Burkholderiales bacterium]|jgi:hypothetical protein|nr:hypothetical protein [Burkholderiales bacterium]
MPTPREITQPSYFRTAKNVNAAIGKGLGVIPGVGQDEVILPAAVTSLPGGVTTEDLPQGGHRSMQVEGKVTAKGSAAIALHALIQCGTDGRFATAVTGSAIWGRAMSACAGADGLFELELWKGRFIAP